MDCQTCYIFHGLPDMFHISWIARHVTYFMDCQTCFIFHGLPDMLHISWIARHVTYFMQVIRVTITSVQSSYKVAKVHSAKWIFCTHSNGLQVVVVINYWIWPREVINYSPIFLKFFFIISNYLQLLGWSLIMGQNWAKAGKNRYTFL